MSSVALCMRLPRLPLQLYPVRVPLEQFAVDQVFRSLEQHARIPVLLTAHSLLPPGQRHRRQWQWLDERHVPTNKVSQLAREAASITETLAVPRWIMNRLDVFRVDSHC